jgi:hypothetical protein
MIPDIQRDGATRPPIEDLGRRFVAAIGNHPLIGPEGEVDQLLAAGDCLHSQYKTEDFRTLRGVRNHEGDRVAGERPRFLT